MNLWEYSFVVWYIWAVGAQQNVLTIYNKKLKFDWTSIN